MKANRHIDDGMELPLVTIITLIYNTGSYVVQTLESVRNQGYPNIQHIVIDDCSEDNSVGMVLNWLEANDYAVEFVRHERNLGVTKSLNDGLRRTKGKYLSIVCDDLFLPHKLHHQVSLFERLPEEYGVLYSDILMRKDNGEVIGTLFSKYRDFLKGPEGIVVEDLFLGNFVHGSAALIKTKCFEVAGYYNEALMVEDVDMFLKIALKFKFKFDYKISAVYRIHDKSLLQTIGISGVEDNLKALEPYCKYNERTLSHFISYLDAANHRFFFENFVNWRIWYKKRVKYKIDTKSIIMYLIAQSQLSPTVIKRLRVLRQLVNNAIRPMWHMKRKKAEKIDLLRKTSFSQCGEDLIVKYIFNLRGINKPSYIDIGANSPFFLNNTAIFYKEGCRGINIDANPALIELFNKERPGDININIGIGNQNSKLEFYIMKDDTLSTFSKIEFERMQSVGLELREKVEVSVRTIQDVLAEYNNNIFPDFLSLDVEGLDLDILHSIDFDKHHPKVICVEAAEYSKIGAGKRREEVIDFVASKGYYEYANTNLNAIMVKNEFWFLNSDGIS